LIHNYAALTVAETGMVRKNGRHAFGASCTAPSSSSVS
jgi:hypothetical protein